MKKKMPNKYRITTQDKVILRGRTKPETFERYFTVNAYSALQARKSAKGKVIKVEKI